MVLAEIHRGHWSTTGPALSRIPRGDIGGPGLMGVLASSGYVFQGPWYGGLPD